TPRYNRRSRRPDRVHWLKVTVEPWPRLSLVRAVRDDDATYLGPFRSRRTAETVRTALHETFPIRQCSGRLALVASGSPCALAAMGRCLSPCDSSADADAYAALVAEVRACMTGSVDPVVDVFTTRMAALAADER